MLARLHSHDRRRRRDDAQHAAGTCVQELARPWSGAALGAGRRGARGGGAHPARTPSPLPAPEPRAPSRANAPQECQPLRSVCVSLRRDEHLCGRRGPPYEPRGGQRRCCRPLRGPLRGRARANHAAPSWCGRQRSCWEKQIRRLLRPRRRCACRRARCCLTCSLAARRACPLHVPFSPRCLRSVQPRAAAIPGLGGPARGAAAADVRDYDARRRRPPAGAPPRPLCGGADSSLFRHSSGATLLLASAAACAAACAARCEARAHAASPARVDGAPSAAA